MAIPTYSTTNWHLTVPAFINQAITDTNPHTSAVIDARGYATKALLVQNGLNQSVSIQVQVSSDGQTNWTNVGNAQSVGAGTKVAIGPDTIAALGHAYPYYQLVATCSTAPTTGSLSATVEMAVNN